MSKDTVITTLDQAGEHEDVEVILDANSVFFRQWREGWDCYELIEMSNQQLNDIVTAMNSAEGAYYAS